MKNTYKSSVTKRTPYVFVLFLILAAITPPLLGQGLGAISGTVTDPTGAVIPSAAVTATQADTGTTTEVKTKERKDTWGIVNASDGSVSFCTTFDPFKLKEPNFTKEAILQINEDFDRGAVALKNWKNIGEEVKNKKGKYVLPDDPIFKPIYDDIAAHNKTLIAHVADPTTVFEAPNPAAPDYTGYINNPGFYMYRRSDAPSKPEILRARDHVLEANPNLRVVGAHLGSMEADFGELGDHLDKYPNFAVDLAARMDYLVIQPRSFLLPFIKKYQDRLIYATDLEIFPGEHETERIKSWENSYALDWRFLATTEWLIYRGHLVLGLGLPQPILHKLYHDNAVKWFPGIVGDAH